MYISPKCYNSDCESAGNSAVAYHWFSPNVNTSESYYNVVFIIKMSFKTKHHEHKCFKTTGEYCNQTENFTKLILVLF